jgi:hypothetical protein
MLQKLDWFISQHDGRWPPSAVKDLELRLMDALSYRTCNADDIWDEISAWLKDNHIMLQVENGTNSSETTAERRTL